MTTLQIANRILIGLWIALAAGMAWLPIAWGLI